MTWRTDTGAGRSAFRILTGEATVNGSSEAQLFGNVGRHHAFQRIAGIGLGIDDRHIDAVAADRVGAGEIDGHAVADRDRAGQT
jgi:hypothetical protein